MYNMMLMFPWPKTKSRNKLWILINVSTFQDQYPIRDIYILLVFNILILISLNFNKQNVYGEEMP